jgi:hypothetical protein
LKLLFTLPESWDDSHGPLHPAFYWLRWGLNKFLLGLALNNNPPDYTCGPLFLA